MKKLALLLFMLPLLTAASCQPPASIATRADVIEAIDQAFGPYGQTAKAIRVAECESGLVPTAVSPNGAWVGLFQLSSNYIPTVRFYNGTGDRKDPYGNAAAARDAWLNRGNWSAWPVCGQR